MGVDEAAGQRQQAFPWGGGTPHQQHVARLHHHGVHRDEDRGVRGVGPGLAVLLQQFLLLHQLQVCLAVGEIPQRLADAGRQVVRRSGAEVVLGGGGGAEQPLADLAGGNAVDQRHADRFPLGKQRKIVARLAATGADQADARQAGVMVTCDVAYLALYVTYPDVVVVERIQQRHDLEARILLFVEAAAQQRLAFVETPGVAQRARLPGRSHQHDDLSRMTQGLVDHRQMSQVRRLKTSDEYQAVEFVIGIAHRASLAGGWAHHYGRGEAGAATRVACRQAAFSSVC